ncbi:uncharacterized protein LOC116474997 isoform X5 [Hylobates moloch]|uniref:uncharacterized protein LOC116474997 isoform X5 n=1 Tax=Hylobates moloch TaxID=81572 RepID=UPI00267599F0|nr:uncharacterized protein LOC116474997 isoform X5 [Hylobates moloch]
MEKSRGLAGARRPEWASWRPWQYASLGLFTAHPLQPFPHCDTGAGESDAWHGKPSLGGCCGHTSAGRTAGVGDFQDALM